MRARRQAQDRQLLPLSLRHRLLLPLRQLVPRLRAPPPPATGVLPGWFPQKEGERLPSALAAVEVTSAEQGGVAVARRGWRTDAWRGRGCLRMQRVGITSAQNRDGVAGAEQGRVAGAWSGRGRRGVEEQGCGGPRRPRGRRGTDVDSDFQGTIYRHPNAWKRNQSPIPFQRFIDLETQFR